jgi:hypothetical protein
MGPEPAEVGGEAPNECLLAGTGSNKVRGAPEIWLTRVKRGIDCDTGDLIYRRRPQRKVPSRQGEPPK